MSQMVCRCGAPFAANDNFCGICGGPLTLAVPPTDRMPAGRSTANPAIAAFSHAEAPGAGNGALSNATRYLCAAAYLSPSFADQVLGGLLFSRRSVAPSRGINLYPIIRHCLAARRMQQIRDTRLRVLLGVGAAAGALTLTLSSSFGALFAIVSPVFFAAAEFYLSFIPGARWQRSSAPPRMLIGMTADAWGRMSPALLLLVLPFILISLGISYGRTRHVHIPWVSLVELVAVAAVDLALIAATLVQYSYLLNWALAEWLKPGGCGPQFERQPESVESRITEVCCAQYGNLTLYDSENPFIGAGATPFTQVLDEERVWSIAIELNRKGTRRKLLDATPKGEVRIDPVDLHRELRDRLQRLDDEKLPLCERVRAITVDDAILGEGRLRWDSPLIDLARQIPYSQASPESIEALIRHPQAGLRYYQRISIRDEGQTVFVGPRPVIGQADQEIVISALVYVAVEGHMFYLQFVPAMLPPLASEYHIVDRMPKVTSVSFYKRVLADATSTSLSHIGHAGTAIKRESKNSAAEAQSAGEYEFADLGACLSVRELGSADWPGTYIQRLDAKKYTQVLERLVLETVLDHLESKDADTTAYRANAEAIYNSGVIAVGRNVNVSAGSGAARQTAT